MKTKKITKAIQEAMDRYPSTVFKYTSVDECGSRYIYECIPDRRVRIWKLGRLNVLVKSTKNYIGLDPKKDWKKSLRKLKK